MSNTKPKSISRCEVLDNALLISRKLIGRHEKERVTNPTGTEKQVCDDIAERQALGIAKYGTTVAENPLELKEWLQHAYEETLDKAIYLKRAIAELQ